MSTNVLIIKIRGMEKDTDTNFGWWTDKPERTARSGRESRWSGPVAQRKVSKVWINAMLIVALAVALVWSLISLTT